MPRPWNLEDSLYFVELAKKLAKDLGASEDDLKEDGDMVKFFHNFPL